MFYKIAHIIGMKGKLSGQGALSSLIKKYFAKSEDNTHMLSLNEVLTAYSGAVFLVLIILFSGSALYFFLIGQVVAGTVILVLGLILLAGSIYIQNTTNR